MEEKSSTTSFQPAEFTPHVGGSGIQKTRMGWDGMIWYGMVWYGIRWNGASWYVWVGMYRMKWLVVVYNGVVWDGMG